MRGPKGEEPAEAVAQGGREGSERHLLPQEIRNRRATLLFRFWHSSCQYFTFVPDCDCDLVASFCVDVEIVMIILISPPPKKKWKPLRPSCCSGFTVIFFSFLLLFCLFPSGWTLKTWCRVVWFQLWISFLYSSPPLDLLVAVGCVSECVVPWVVCSCYCDPAVIVVFFPPLWLWEAGSLLLLLLLLLLHLLLLLLLVLLPLCIHHIPLRGGAMIKEHQMYDPECKQSKKAQQLVWHKRRRGGPWSFSKCCSGTESSF